MKRKVSVVAPAGQPDYLSIIFHCPRATHIFGGTLSGQIDRLHDTYACILLRDTLYRPSLIYINVIKQLQEIK